MVKDAYKAKGIKYADMLKVAKEDGRSAYAHHVDQTVALRGEALKSQVEAQFAALKAMNGAGEDELSLEA